MHALDLCLEDDLLVDVMGRVLLPLEAFGAVTDVVAVSVFAFRSVHRGINTKPCSGMIVEYIIEMLIRQYPPCLHEPVRN